VAPRASTPRVSTPRRPALAPAPRAALSWSRRQVPGCAWACGLTKAPSPLSRKKIPAIAYLRTSSATNASLGNDKDSDKRQRAAIAAFAKASGYVIVEEFYDVVSGADPIAERSGFRAMLDRIASNGVRCIIVESPDRFARDLTVQLTGHDFLKSLGVSLILATAPDFFTEDTPTAVLVRQVLGAIAQFEKTSLVAKLKAARDRKKGSRASAAAASRMLRRVPTWCCWRSRCTTTACRFGISLRPLPSRAI
jgi:predicted site-specific integrase-resolvase